ncbi:MAG: bifunctional (p)ppGpp synthetase/guanosine-3',5'-bis(diphosphate) 3'-pyrophosphohydrolase [Acidobacteria bacterium]|nr:bifunctional (p)ppGpp synthetase/guanosine-3',5'-bis(diphosphate) 3'-pyrophosphohydrolase [Acidobacteriota bacterium]
MNWDPERYIEALRFAAERHGGQRLPGSDIPYLFHLSCVAMEVLHAAAEDPEINLDLALTCALLHDVVEDTGAETEVLRERFGDAVAGGVAALTKRADLPGAERMADSLRRIRKQGREVAMVKLADRVVNLQPPPAHWTPAKIEAYRQEARGILHELGSASPALARRLAEKIAEYGWDVE